jgi:hypothetical protein
MDHTRFLGSVYEAEREYDLMKKELDKVLEVFASRNLNNLMAWEAISVFVSKFP